MKTSEEFLTLLAQAKTIIQPHILGIFYNKHFNHNKGVI